MISNLKKEILLKIEERMPSIIDIVKDIGEHPELGYKEFRTSGIVNDFLCQVGYTTEQLAITGIKTKLKDENTYPTIAIIGELDGITCPESCKADKETGATHHCGHNLQLGVIMAIAQAFKTIGISAELTGNISFIASPAEEYIDLEYRSELRRKGVIKYFGGKQELVRCGAFDDINAAIMIHSQSNKAFPYAGVIKSGNGLIAEKIRYIGKSSHAAASPHLGINALSAAVMGINGVNAIRDTFRDDNHDRVHYIITKGGDTINSVPADVRLECMVRSNTITSMKEILKKTNKAFSAGGDAIGCKTEIQLLSGYLPLVCNEELNALFMQSAKTFIPERQIEIVEHFNASTDMGDITHLMPAIHPLIGGATGSLHAADFEVVDYKAAIEIPAKIISLMLIDLLSNDAKKIKSIIDRHPQQLSQPEYLSLLESFFT